MMERSFKMPRSLRARGTIADAAAHEARSTAPSLLINPAVARRMSARPCAGLDAEEGVRKHGRGRSPEGR